MSFIDIGYFEKERENYRLLLYCYI